jgi:amino acid transporter
MVSLSLNRLLSLTVSQFLSVIPPLFSDLSGLTLLLQLSLSLFFSFLGSLGLRREERRKNIKGKERRR